MVMCVRRFVFPDKTINPLRGLQTESEISFVTVVIASEKKLQTVKYEESRVWRRQELNKPWLNVHVHSATCPASRPRSAERTGS